MKKYYFKNIMYKIKIPYTMIYNYFLLKRYPWLTPYNVWSGKLSDDYDYRYTWYDDIPYGWKKGFGKLFIKDIDKAINSNPDNMHIQQVKEKYGGLRWYSTTTEEANKVIDSYSHISENTCICCGKPEAYMLNLSWISPYCKKCFNKLKRRSKYFAKDNYEDYIYEEDTGKLPISYSYIRGNNKVTVDISDTSNKVIRRWNRLHPFNKVREEN